MNKGRDLNWNFSEYKPPAPWDKLNFDDIVLWLEKCRGSTPPGKYLADQISDAGQQRATHRSGVRTPRDVSSAASS